MAAAVIAARRCAGGDGGAGAPPAAAASDIVATAPGWVDVQGGTQRLGARSDGVVQSIAVKDGDSVAAGDLLLRLDDQQAQIDTHLAEVELQRRRQEQAALGAQLGRA